MTTGLCGRRPCALAAVAAEADGRSVYGASKAGLEVADVVRYLILQAPGHVTGARIEVDEGAETVA